MSKLDSLDFPAASVKSIARVAGRIEARRHTQATAAVGTADFVWLAECDGQIGDAFVALAVLPASGESMTVDILKNGTSIMTGGTAKTLSATTATAKTVDVWGDIDPAKRSFVAGDVFTTTRGYTAGGTPAMTISSVVIEPAPSGIPALRTQ